MREDADRYLDIHTACLLTDDCEVTYSSKFKEIKEMRNISSRVRKTMRKKRYINTYMVGIYIYIYIYIYILTIAKKKREN